MTLDLWLAFLAASAVLLAIPGPTVVLVLSYALGLGRRAALATVAGVMLGDFVAMTLSIAGLGALLAASAEWFGLLRLAGGAYLVWLGIRLWRAPVIIPDAVPARRAAPPPGRKIFGHAFAVTALNPKSIVFFIAFVPQFIRADAPLLPQVATLEASFVVLAGLNAGLYAMAGAAARSTIRRPGVQRTVNRIGGGALIAAGAAAALWRR